MIEIPDQFLNTRWTFDRAQNTEEILEAYGAPWIIRKLIKGKMEQGYFYLVNDGDHYILETFAPKNNAVYKFKLGEEFENVGFDGRKHKLQYHVEGEDLIEVHEHLEGPRKGEKGDRYIWRIENEVLVGLNSKENKKGEVIVWKKWFKKI